MTDSHCYVAPRSPYPWMRLVHRALPMLCVCVSSDIHIEKHSFFIPLLIPLFSTPRDLVSWTLITTGGVMQVCGRRHMLNICHEHPHKNNACAVDGAVPVQQGLDKFVIIFPNCE
jgi:hypothetical protein